MNLIEEEKSSLNKLISSMHGMDVENIALSKFVKLNYSIFEEFKKIGVSQKKQAEIVGNILGKTVSHNSLAVAISRLTPSEDNNKVIIMEKLIPQIPVNKNHDVIIMEKSSSHRFVNKNIKLILGTQKEITEIIEKNGEKILKEKVIDWRALAPGESISNWILDYKNELVAINKTGWRWNQIADAISNHLNLKKQFSGNTLTSVISLSNKKITQNKQTN